MNMRTLGPAISLLVAVSAVACSSSNRRSGFAVDENATDPAGSAQGGAGTDGKSSFGDTTDAGPLPAAQCEHQSGDPDTDYDNDGFTLKDDCNECDVNANKGAFDVPGNGIDEDCNGTPDDEETECDDGLDIEGTDAFDGAKAIGLCKKATDDKMWGVIEAEWVTPDGAPQSEPLSQGILPKFGVNKPQAGKSMLAISSGSARGPSDPGYHPVSGWGKDSGSGLQCGTPAGYPKESPSCDGQMDFGSSDAYDGAALRVKLRVPTNANSFSYQQNFFTYEFPTFICSNYNDFFVTMMDPKPAGLPDGNIAFDQDGNPISVNNSLLQVCKERDAGGKHFDCPLGDSGLSGTGFTGHAASGWLTTKAPVDTVRGKEITLMWAIWDQGDGSWDSSALVDDFAWSVEAAKASTTAPSPVK